MKNFFSKMFLKESIEFHGSIKDLKKKLKEKGKGYNVEWISKKEFKFLAVLSIGTFRSKYVAGAIEGIKGYAVIKGKKDKSIELLLTTRLRIEIYIFFLFFLFASMIAFISEDEFPWWIYLLIPLVVICTWFFYRFQENALFSQFKTHLLSKDDISEGRSIEPPWSNWNNPNF